MKVLVTGGAGFIGSEVVRMLIRDTETSVVTLDKLTYSGNLRSLEAVAESPRHRFEQADICDAAELDRIFETHRPDAVIHLAAESHVDRSIDGPAEFVRTNLVGTYELLEASRRFLGLSTGGPSTDAFRFLHVSTDEVFGDLHGQDAYFTETTPYAPSSPYAATKAGSDHLVRAWQRTYGLPVVITNCSNNYGPYQFPEKLIPHVILNALAGKPLPVYGDGSQIRDWLYVEDHARAIWTVLTRGTVGESYNVGGHNEKSNIDVVRRICRILEGAGREPPQSGRFEDLIAFVDDRPGHDRRYAIDAGKIASTLDWEPRETFETGLVKTVNWYLDNEAWWQSVLDGSYKLSRLGKLESL